MADNFEFDNARDNSSSAWKSFGGEVKKVRTRQLVNKIKQIGTPNADLS